ncbi:Uncharacterised protein [Vibrio cholerae]|nr:Uncharacterised protein [Vibrio cholerae]CSI51042.1 Uncharacterised protein [Vibrio cholerae]
MRRDIGIRLIRMEEVKIRNLLHHQFFRRRASIRIGRSVLGNIQRG